MAKHWYVVHTYSNYEKQVKTDLEHRIETYGMQKLITDIQIPTEEVSEIKDGGQRETKDQKVFPGYVLVYMEMNDDTWSVVRNTAGVTGFAGIDGASGNPTPLRRSEFNKIMRRVNPRAAKDTAKHVTTTTNLEQGDTVKVVSGPLEGFEGPVTEVMAEAGKVKVMLVIFGRDTPVELEISQVAKAV